MSALRVLVSGLVFDLGPGGVQRHAAELLPRAAARLEAHGGSLAVLLGSGGLTFELPDNIERIQSGAPGHPAYRRASAETPALRAAIAAAKERARPFGLVHTAHLPTPRDLGLPLAWLVHDLRRIETGPRILRWLAKREMTRAVRKSAGVLTVSSATAARLGYHFKVEADVIPNGAEHLQPVPRAPLPNAPLLYVGHVEPRKDVATLVRALALDTSLPDLYIAGIPKGDHQARLQAKVERLELGSRVRFLGAIDELELRELYATCAAVVLPSTYEGFGIVALEALASGAPLACSDLAAHREVAGDCASYFPVGDAAACARAIGAAISQAIDQPNSQTGQERSQSFSWNRSADLLVDTWQRLARAARS
ncbi:MAG: glycosyltransferase involved in cell wall biosynthesis [Planctomycetota bacterium]